ncbi:MAG: hypothetical protein ACRDI2_17810 [Chloroflexota bacterium]
MSASAGGPRERFLYKSGSYTATQHTPRPGTDDEPGGGLSFWNSIDHPMIKSGHVIELDLDLLPSPLTVIPDDQPPGHRLVRPAGPSFIADPLLKEWAVTRPHAEASPHALTIALLAATNPVRKR